MAPEAKTTEDVLADLDALQPRYVAERLKPIRRFLDDLDAAAAIVSRTGELKKQQAELAQAVATRDAELATARSEHEAAVAALTADLEARTRAARTEIAEFDKATAAAKLRSAEAEEVAVASEQRPRRRSCAAPRPKRWRSPPSASGTRCWRRSPRYARGSPDERRPARVRGARGISAPARARIVHGQCGRPEPPGAPPARGDGRQRPHAPRARRQRTAGARGVPGAARGADRRRPGGVHFLHMCRKRAAMTTNGEE
jgi:multidrug efflux pump subunit AcrA (membrane-fusion protein)